MPVTIPVSDECAAVLPDHALGSARRQLLWESLLEADTKVGGSLESWGPHDVKADELRQAVERVRVLTEELIDAQERAAA